MKRYAVSAFVYALLAMAFGVFYREFTKIAGFTGHTNLSVMHTHYFAMGMLFFLLVLVIDKLFEFSGRKATRWFFVLYSVGLNITAAMLFARGLVQVLGVDISPGIDASISGVAGIGHALLATGVILFFTALLKCMATKKYATISPHQ